MRSELLSENMTGRTWATLAPLLKAYQLEPFEDYARDMRFGSYRMEHWEHDTASQIRIYAVLANEELLVYREDKWRGDFEHHNRDTIQGYQIEGPWVEDLESYRRTFNATITAHLNRVRLADLRRRAGEDQADAAKIRRFTEAFE